MKVVYTVNMSIAQYIPVCALCSQVLYTGVLAKEQCAGFALVHFSVEGKDAWTQVKIPEQASFGFQG